jgi:hypothetical protein
MNHHRLRRLGVRCLESFCEWCQRLISKVTSLKVCFGANGVDTAEVTCTTRGTEPGTQKFQEAGRTSGRTTEVLQTDDSGREVLLVLSFLMSLSE